MEFERAWARTMTWEGGGRVHTVPGDPGGTTKWGISQRAYPDVDIPNLTAREARGIARRDYWDRVGGDDLPPTIRWDVFDFGFNAGNGRSVQTLQRTINLCKDAFGHSDHVAVDGIIGPHTLSEAAKYPAERLLLIFRAYRREHYMALAENGKAKFIYGWLRRAEGGTHG